MPRTNLASDNVMAALTQFINLRRTGHNRDEAWYQVIQKAGLDTGDEVELLTLAKKWEQREGNKYLDRSTQGGQNPNATLMAAPAPSIPKASAHTSYLDPNALAQYEAALKKANPAFTTSPLQDDTTPYEIKPSIPMPPMARTMQIVIYFRDFPDPIRIALQDGKEAIVGRTTPDSPMSPDIDLTPLRGGELGISRIHASLERRGDTLYLSDLDSRNHTFIGEERLMPQEIRALKSGDYVWFGRMLTQVQYRLE